MKLIRIQLIQQDVLLCDDEAEAENELHTLDGVCTLINIA